MRGTVTDAERFDNNYKARLEIRFARGLVKEIRDSHKRRMLAQVALPIGASTSGMERSLQHEIAARQSAVPWLAEVQRQELEARRNMELMELQRKRQQDEAIMQEEEVR